MEHFRNHAPRKRQGPIGTTLTNQKLSDLLTSVLRSIQKDSSQRADLILASWEEIVGAQIASMSQAVSFTQGILSIKVRNSTLLSLLRTHDRQKLFKN